MFRQRANQGPEARHVASDRRRTRRNALPAVRAISRCRLALAAKPYDVFFLAEVPSQNLEENLWNATNLQGCMQAKTSWVKLVSLKDENKRSTGSCRRLTRTSLPEPHWPSQSLNKLITLTFEGRMITGAGPSGPVASPRRQNHRVVNGYGRAVVVDFEYEASDGNLPDRIVHGGV